MSIKNKLQEYCQKNHQPLPIYTTIMTGGMSNDPIWQSELSIGNRKYAQTAKGGSKTSLESHLAQMAYDDLFENTISLIDKSFIDEYKFKDDIIEKAHVIQFKNNIQFICELAFLCGKYSNKKISIYTDRDLSILIDICNVPLNIVKKI
jgi:hypothetical protein